jgi:hypothetical protein
VTITDPERTIEQIEEAVRMSLTPLQDVRKPISGPRIVSVQPTDVVVRYSLLVNTTADIDHEIMMTLAKSLGGAAIEAGE